MASVGSSRSHAPVVDLCERQVGLGADLELFRLGRVRVVDVLDAPLPQECLGVGGPGLPRHRDWLDFGQAPPRHLVRDQIKWRGLPCPLKSEGSPEQLGGPLGASLKPEGSPESKWVSGPLWSAGGWPRGSDCAPVVRQLGQSQGAQAQKTVDQLEGRNSFFFLGGASESDRPRCFFFLPMPVTTATATTSTWV